MTRDDGNHRDPFDVRDKRRRPPHHVVNRHELVSDQLRAVSPTARLVWVLLGTYTAGRDVEGREQWSMTAADLARDLDVSAATIRRCVSELLACGVLEVTARTYRDVRTGAERQGGNWYELRDPASGWSVPRWFLTTTTWDPSQGGSYSVVITTPPGGGTQERSPGGDHGRSPGVITAEQASEDFRRMTSVVGFPPEGDTPQRAAASSEPDPLVSAVLSILRRRLELERGRR